MRYLLIVISLLIISCGGSKSEDFKKIEDLPFDKAEDAKSYSDLILKSIRTNRELPVWQEFEDNSTISQDTLRMFVNMYSSGIGGRDDWEYIDVYKDSAEKDSENEFDYAWLDPSDRLAMQIKIIPKGTANGFKLERIEFRSRLDVVDSRAFPGGIISDYEKLEYDWGAKMKRTVEKSQK